MAKRDKLENEVRLLRRDFSAYADAVEEYIEETPERRRFARVERLQIGVAVAVLTAFVSLFTSRMVQFTGTPIDCVGESGFHCALSFEAAYAGVFLSLKLFTMTVRPIWDTENEIITLLDEYWLPASYLPLLPMSLIAGFGIIAWPSGRFPGFTGIYMVLQLLVVVTIGRGYARNYQETMTRVYSSTTDQAVTITSGPSGDSTALHLEHSRNETIKEGDIRFIVDAPEKVSVRLQQAYPADEQDVWVFAHALEPDHPVRVPVNMTITGSRKTLSRDTVTITIEVEGEIQEIEEFDIVG